MSVVNRVLLSALLVAAPISQVLAQEPSPGTAAAEPAAPDPPQEARIVEGRPALYSFKRAIHPLNWLAIGFEPVFRSAESGRINQLLTRKPDDTKISGVRFGAAGMGAGSGFGPTITFFHKDLLGRGIDVEVPLLYTYSGYQQYQFKASVPLASETFVDRLSFDV